MNKKKNDYKIDTSEKIKIQDKNYFLRIRTEDENLPMLLFLHGGCGSPDRAQVMKYQSPLAKYFTLVCWDQRGAGMAYDKKESKQLKLNQEIYVEDTHRVICYLKERFQTEKLILVGHSFGTVLAVWTLMQYPHDAIAYIGIGQAVDYDENERLSYLFTLEEAKKRADKKAMKVLEEIGEPVNGIYKKDHLKAQVKQRAYLHKYGGSKAKNRKTYLRELILDEYPILRREYHLVQMIRYIKGINYCLGSEIANKNPRFLETVKQLNLPVIIVSGKRDFNCVASLAKKWFDQLDAPKKEWIVFENSAHFPQWEEADLFNKIIRERLSNIL